MFSLLIIIIYIAFISLGLPDSLFGAAWPVMQNEFSVPISYAGFVSVTISCGTIFSSLMSDRLTKKLGTGLITAISVLLSAAGLLGFSFADRIWVLCLCAIPYGLGAGAVDAALNNYVALHYKSRHMNWLHSFWGVGASISPLIMGFFLTKNLGWSGGYRTVSIIQFAICALLFTSLPIWKKRQSQAKDAPERPAPIALSKIFRLKGIVFVMLAFFGYCALEVTAGLWASSYLVNARGVNAETAAGCASFFFIGITGGRFLCGFISNRIGNKNMIRIGLTVIFAGLTAVFIPAGAVWLCYGGLITVGIGCAPIFPAIIHSTPDNFGAENSQAVIGVQMACAYTGAALMPPLFGLIANHININLYPVYLLFFLVLMTMMTELLNRKVRKSSTPQSGM